MTHQKSHYVGLLCAMCVLSVAAFVAPARAEEIWVAPNAEQDLGGLGIASNVVWPVTPVGAVRFAWAVPDDLQTFQSAKVVLIPQAADGASTLNVIICPAQHGDVVGGGCAGPFAQAFSGSANQLVEVEIGGLIASRIGTPGANYLAVLAFTTPTTATDHLVGLRFGYTPKAAAGVASLAGNTFTGTQTAPAFVGDGSGLTNLPAIQNSTSPQAGASFNISGDGTAAGTLSGNVVNATTSININSNPALVVNGGAGVFQNSNTFGGVGAGHRTIPTPMTTGLFNTFFGFNAGFANTDGVGNSFFGNQAGINNTTANFNSIFGELAGQVNSTGSFNTFVGSLAGSSNHTEDNNTMIGGRSTGATGVTNGTAIGFRSQVAQSNSLVLGSINGVNGSTADTSVGIGTTAPTARLHVVGDGLFTGNLTVNGTLNAPSSTFSAATIVANTQYSIGSNRVLAVSGTQNTNTFVGVQAGNANPTGNFNSFFGNGSGLQVSTGSDNTFFGSGSGNQVTDGTDNSFFGRNAGFANSASQNSFFGSFAGSADSTGAFNAFFGFQAGLSNTVGTDNSFFGYQAGNLNNTGSDNAFFGRSAGQSSTGNNNSFFGSLAGISNTSGSENAFFGAGAGNDVSTQGGNSFFGYAAGHGSGQLGSSNSFFGHFSGAGAAGSNSSYFGESAGSFAIGDGNSFFGSAAGGFYQDQVNNTSIGVNSKIVAHNSVALGANAVVGTSLIDNSSAIGANAMVTASNSVVLGSINGVNGAAADTNVGIGMTAPASRLHVNGSVRVTNGAIYVSNPNTLIITSPNGACWGITVSNAGGIGAFSTPCPQ